MHLRSELLALTTAVLSVACSRADGAATTDPGGGEPTPIDFAPAPMESGDGERGTPSPAPHDSADEPGNALKGAPGSACSADMRLVEGSYCLAVEHHCLAWQEVVTGGVRKRNQCKEYREPSTCFEDRRKPLRFCMDTYEWPNEKGALPRVLTPWQDAKQLCESVGKRLCTEEEFNFACEGESLKPHVYGAHRDDDKCSIDRDYRPRTFPFSRWDDCMGDEACKKAFEEIDQRVPAGSMLECISDHGVYDLNGNANEWVMRPHQRSPDRSGLKGGWWGPVRNRCRPMVTFHDEGDWGYEVGFRCCSDVSASDE